MEKRNVLVGSVYEGFFSGGARIQHTDMIKGLNERGVPQTVFSLHDQITREGGMTQHMERDACFKTLQGSGIPVSSLQRHSPASQPFTEQELRKTQKFVETTDVILSLKEQPLTMINQIDTAGKPVIACLHRSDPEHQGPALDALLQSIDSGKLTRAVCCAESTKIAYKNAGVPEHLLHVITNGVDLTRFASSAEKQKKTREALAIPAKAPVVIFPARYDEMKDVPLFLAAANTYLQKERSAHIIMCGSGMSDQNPTLRQDMSDALTTDVSERIHPLGIRHDMEALYAAADIVTLTSAFGEAYPLSLIEGMACGAVPVSTDVGDCRDIVSNRGIIAERDAASVAMAWQEAYDQRTTLQPIILETRKQFDRERMIDIYNSYIHSLLPPC